MREALALSHSLTKLSNTPPYKVVQIPLSFPCGTKLPPLTSELPLLGLTWVATNVGFEILGKTETTHVALVVHQMGQYFSNPPPDLKSSFRDMPIISACLNTSVSAETVKLNFCLGSKLHL